MATVKDIFEFINTVAPGYMKESWDNVGLNCGRMDKEVGTILVALDPFAHVCQEAVDVGADLLLQFSGLTCGGGALPDGICGADVIVRCVVRAGKHAGLDFIALFCGEQFGEFAKMQAACFTENEAHGHHAVKHADLKAQHLLCAGDEPAGQVIACRGELRQRELRARGAHGGGGCRYEFCGGGGGVFCLCFHGKKGVCGNHCQMKF